MYLAYIDGASPTKYRLRQKHRVRVVVVALTHIMYFIFTISNILALDVFLFVYRCMATHKHPTRRSATPSIAKKTGFLHYPVGKNQPKVKHLAQKP